MLSKGTRIVIAALCLGGFTMVVWFQQRTVTRLRQENRRLEQQLAAAQAPVAIQTAETEFDTNELARLRAQEKELIRLRGEVTMLRAERRALTNQMAATKPRSVAPSAPTQNVDTAWVQQVLNSPPAQQGLAAGTLRAKILSGERSNISASELALQEALAQKQLNQTLERSPAAFADFQTAFIQGAVGISDPAKLQQVHDLIRQTYEHAVANGLDVSSKPATDADPWVQQRHQLDRRATAAVERILTPEERSAFGRAFLGVMGVDLGRGDVDKSNYPRGFLGP
jgi:hypothetical protein